MARPAEKARAMMNKWVKMREEGNAGPAIRGKRPMLASECQHLADAEFYRNQIIREITGGIAKIQNPGLGEHSIRDLNDEINKKMREKYHWNRRIKELGGLDYNSIERKRQMEEGDLQSLQGPGGYRYYGAAKDLPGVKELFEKQVLKLQSRKRGEIFKNITPDYYGWRDEEDGVLLELEEAAFETNKRQRLEGGGEEPKDNELDGDFHGDYLDVPSQDEVSQLLLEHKKQSLLSRFSI
jgi:pre-mRNA-splicing factor ISY1